MLTDIGEFIVGAPLQLIEECDFVNYNIRPPSGCLEGLGELDIVGINFNTSTAYLCEVTTHILGLRYKNNKETVNRIQNKHERQKEYAETQLAKFKNHVFMFWSPVVPVGYITEHLNEIESLEKIINGEYKKRIEQLRLLAKDATHGISNPWHKQPMA